jgi:Domain of unknown function (DUF4258)
MSYAFSIHVQQEMQRRGISQSVIETVLTSPDQKAPEHGDVVCYQSKVEFDQKQYLVRVMVNETVTPMKVVTVYRTSKIGKYWRQDNESDL